MGKGTSCKDVDALFTIFLAAATVATFIKEMSLKNPATALLPNKLMWKSLKALNANLTFTKVAVADAQTRVIKRTDGTWPRVRTESEQKDWVQVCCKRIRAQARFISQCLLKSSRSKKAWLTELFSEDTPASRRSGAAPAATPALA